MLRLDSISREQPMIWEAVLPPELIEMNEELTGLDELLNDDRFLAPFREKFSTRIDRPTTTVVTYLRMMYLKRRYQPEYEVLVKEVKDIFTSSRIVSNSSL